MTDFNLQEDEIETIKKFIEKINNSKIGNENKVYMNTYTDALLSNNFIAAANIGFTFLEKYLRTKLVFFENQNQQIHEDNFLQSLDTIEKMLEDGEGENSVSSKFNNLKNNIQKYGYDDSNISKEQLIEELEKYIELVNTEGAYPKNGYQFIDICKKLKEYGKIDNTLKNELSKLYRKYRNPAHHGLFKRLIDGINGEDANLVPVFCGGIKTTGIREVSPSNMIIRETTDFLTPVTRRISIEIFQLINKTINSLGDFNN